MANRIEIGTAVLHSAANLPRSGPIHVSIRAEDIELLTENVAPPETPGRVNVLPGRVVAISTLGKLYELTLDCGFMLKTHLTARELHKLSLVPGALATALLPPDAVHIIPGRHTDNLVCSTFSRLRTNFADARHQHDRGRADAGMRIDAGEYDRIDSAGSARPTWFRKTRCSAF